MPIRTRPSARALALVVFAVTGLAALGAVFALAPTSPGATLTGEIEMRTFIQDCHCYNWVINKNGKASEADVSAVQDEARALVGQRVRATGRWYTYRRDGQTIRYFKVSRLEAV